MSIVNVANFAGALQGVAATSLRSVIGDILLDDVLSQREQDQRDPPAQARRSHRALGRQSDDRRDSRDPAAAGRPGGDEPAALRRANPSCGHHRVRRHDARRRSTSPRATSSRQSCAPREIGRPRSCGHRASATRCRRSSRPPMGIDQKTMALQYLEALKALGQRSRDQVHHSARVHPAQSARSAQ